MKTISIATSRLHNQQLEKTKFKTPNEVVSWMGAMQAQDFYMAKWAIGIRLPNSTEKIIETAIDQGEIIRTHLLRPTWHFVSRDDIYWMLELSSPQIKSLMKSNNKMLELTDSVFTKSNKIIEKSLAGNKHLTREELVAELTRAKIPTNITRSSNLLMRAELDKIICSGRTKNKKQTYTLLGEWVPKMKSLNKEEALAKLAERYFTSHGPATLQDFTWWSGLLTADAKHALEMVKPTFISETISSKTFWMTNSFSNSIPKPDKKSVYLLPAYDEYLISYKDRSASLPLEHHKKSISINGIFKPTIVLNGEVKGLWKRTFKKEKVIVETEFFKLPAKNLKNRIEKVAMVFGGFLEKETEVIHTIASY